MVNINLKRSGSKEIRIDNNHSIIIDYPTFNQKQELNSILSQIYAIENVIGDKDVDEIKKVELITKKMMLMQEYMMKVVKYCLKGVKGYDFELKLKDNQLDEETFEAVCYDINQVRDLFDIIIKEIEFTDIDKKKLNGV